jgi:hypothetical protein
VDRSATAPVAVQAVASGGTERGRRWLPMSSATTVSAAPLVEASVSPSTAIDAGGETEQTLADEGSGDSDRQPDDRHGSKLEVVAKDGGDRDGEQPHERVHSEVDQWQPSGRPRDACKASVVGCRHVGVAVSVKATRVGRRAGSGRPSKDTFMVRIVADPQSFPRTASHYSSQPPAWRSGTPRRSPALRPVRPYGRAGADGLEAPRV